jgi:hypothetical protein
MATRRLTARPTESEHPETESKPPIRKEYYLKRKHPKE